MEERGKKHKLTKMSNNARKKWEGKIIGQPMIKRSKQRKNGYPYLVNKRFQIRRKTSNV